jgi:DMSO reductase anchor subunit
LPLALRIGESRGPWSDTILPVALVAASLVLWYCTAMSYACLRLVEERAHPLTLANYTLIGLASGLVLFALLTRLGGPPEVVRSAAAWAFALTVIAGVVRVASIVRNTRLRPAPPFLARLEYCAIGAGFVVPALLMLPALVGGERSNSRWLIAAALVQLAGVLSERWYFFAQARQPQNLYCQVVS